MPRTAAILAMLVVLLVATGCGGDEQRAPADLVEDAGPDGAGSEVAPKATPSSDAPAATEAEPSKDTVADTEPVRLGQRFRWCGSVEALWDAQDQARAEAEAADGAHEAAVRVFEAATDDLDRAAASEAVQDAYADYVFAANRHGTFRWWAAGLIFSNESKLLGDDTEDSTLMVAIGRARDAHRSQAAADTLAAFDVAHEATAAVARLNATENSDDESGQPGEAPESDAAAFEASEAWLKATEALQDTIKHAEAAQRARDDAAAAAAVTRAATSEAQDAASAIYHAAVDDGDWKALISDAQAQVAVAVAGAETAASAATQALQAAATAAEAARAALATAEASASARAVANQSGATVGADAYWSIGAGPLSVASDADFSAHSANSVASPTTSDVIRSAQAVEDAAWYVARIAADLDTNAVTAFKESLQESCR